MTAAEGGTPGRTTGVLLTSGVHWLRQTQVGADAAEVAARVGERFGWDVQTWDGGRYYYAATVAVGPVRVYHHPDRPEMGVCLDVPGEACENIGPDGVAWFLGWRGWEVTRFDLAADHLPFTPEMVRDAWYQDDVRTVARVAKVAKAGRESRRTCDWSEKPDGDMFRMGSRQSSQFCRVYDRRGFTRMELELKGAAAASAAAVVGAVLAERDDLAFGEIVVGLLRRFVDFVDRAADSNISRAPLLAWWAAFVEDVSKVRLWLGERVVRSAAEMLNWALHQTAPILGVLSEVFGPGILRDLASEGRGRWQRRHREAVRMAAA